MRRCVVLLIAILLCGSIGSAEMLEVGSGLPHTPTWGRAAVRFTDLQGAIDAAGNGDTIQIGPGSFTAEAQGFLDPLCGNCLEHGTKVAASIGFSVIGKRVHLIGSGPERTTLITRAGYGLYLEGSNRSTIRDLAVTGGLRDRDGNATDAAIVVRNGSVLLENLHLRDNTSRAKDVVVGIGGVMGREGARIEIRGCRILNNGWDGIALYRGARAWIHGNVIAEGRGAGIGITWDAFAVVQQNRISGYWKGIGTFGASRAIVRDNAVFDNLGWGIIATGESYLEASGNLVVRNGNCGFAIWSETARGIAAGNVIVDNGWRKEWVCPRVGFWHRGSRTGFDLSENRFYGNVGGDWLSERGEASPTILPADSIEARSACDEPITRLPAERFRVGSEEWMKLQGTGND